MRLSRRNLMLGAAAAALELSCSPLVERPCTIAPASGCGGPPPLPVDLPAKCCHLLGFDEIHTATPLVYRPQNLEELKGILMSVPAGRQVTFRGGGQSFHDQALNRD